ncbi:MAG: phosphatase PAP2 family protein [Parvibaculaceae bacterium]
MSPVPHLSIERLFELLTKFGDQGFVLPFVVTVAAVLWQARARREALVWLVAVGISLGAILLLKLIFLPCGHLWPGWSVRSPSGHSASAFAAFGGFAVLEAKFRQERWQKYLLLGAGFAFAALIAVSRLVIHVHSVPEVVIGSLIGLIAPLVLLFVIMPDAKRNLANPLSLAPLLPLGLLLLFNGKVLPVESHISAFALWMARSLGVCG